MITALGTIGRYLHEEFGATRIGNRMIGREIVRLFRALPWQDLPNGPIAALVMFSITDLDQRGGLKDLSDRYLSACASALAKCITIDFPPSAFIPDRVSCETIGECTIEVGSKWNGMCNHWDYQIRMTYNPVKSAACPHFWLGEQAEVA
jgi:hypothetical protein